MTKLTALSQASLPLRMPPRRGNLCSICGTTDVEHFSPRMFYRCKKCNAQDMRDKYAMYREDGIRRNKIWRDKKFHNRQEDLLRFMVRGICFKNVYNFCAGSIM